MAAEPLTASVHIEATPEQVFEYFTSPEAIVRWMGDYALLQPTPGGAFEVDINGVPVRGRYLEVEPPHRLLISWGHAGSDRLPPGASTVEVRLSRRRRRHAGGDRAPRPARPTCAAGSGAAGRTSSSGSQSRPPAAIRGPIRWRPSRRAGSSTTAQSPRTSSSPGDTRARPDAPSHEPRAVARAEVHRQPRAVERAQLEVMARDRRLGHDDVAAAAAPDDDRPRGRELHAAPRRRAARAARQRGHVRRRRATSATSTRSSASDRARRTRPRRCSKVSTLRYPSTQRARSRATARSRSRSEARITSAMLRPAVDHVKGARRGSRTRTGRRPARPARGRARAPAAARARRVVEGGDEARRADAVGEPVGVEALGEVEVALGQLAAGEGVAPGAAGVRGRVAAVRARSSR